MSINASARRGRLLLSRSPSVSDPPTAIQPHLTREKASAWFTERGFETLTVVALNKLATQGKGPQYYRLGKFVYYAVVDLEIWLRAEMTLVTDGRAEPVYR